MPCDLTNPVGESLARNLSDAADHVVYRDGQGKALTYADLVASSLDLADELRCLAPPRRTVVVAVFGSNRDWLTYAQGYVATLLAGFCAVPVALDTTAAELDVLTNRLAPDLAVGGHEMIGVLGQVDGWSPTVVVRPATAVAREAGRVEVPRDAFARLLARRVDPSAPAEVLFTSGTTGRRKAVAVPHGAIAGELESSGRRRRPRGLLLHALAFASNAAQTVLREGLRSAGYAVQAVPTDVDAFLRAARSSQPTATVLVPTMALHIVREATKRGEAFESFRSVRISGAPIRSRELDHVATAFPKATVTNLYTSTETWPAWANLARVRGTGHAPGRSLRGSDEPTVRVVSEGGDLLGSGSVGVIEVRSAGWARAYVQRREDDGALLTESVASSAGWVRTTDVGSIDASGRLTLMDRLDDVLNVGGEKVASAVIEEALAGSAGIDGVAAVGLAHRTLGHYVAVAVSPGHVDEQAVKAVARSRLPLHCVPRRVQVVDTLPRNAAGKVDKIAVRALFESSTATSGRRRGGERR